MTTNNKWTYLGRASRDTHKYFRENASDRIAIADLSGTYPDQTDDGVLYLDFSRNMTIKDDSTGGVRLWLPVIDAKGRKSSTPMSGAEYHWVRRNVWQAYVENQ